MAGIYLQDCYGSRGGQVRIPKMLNEAQREGGAH